MNELNSVSTLASLVSEQQHRKNKVDEEQQNDIVANLGAGGGLRRRKGSSRGRSTLWIVREGEEKRSGWLRGTSSRVKLLGSCQ